MCTNFKGVRALRKCMFCTLILNVDNYGQPLNECTNIHFWVVGTVNG